MCVCVRVRASMRELLCLWLCVCVYVRERSSRSVFEFFNEGLSGRRFGDEFAEELKRRISASAHLCLTGFHYDVADVELSAPSSSLHLCIDHKTAWDPLII